MHSRFVALNLNLSHVSSVRFSSRAAHGLTHFFIVAFPSFSFCSHIGVVVAWGCFGCSLLLASGGGKVNFARSRLSALAVWT